MNEIVGPLYYVFASDPDSEWAEAAEADTYYCFQLLMSEIKDNFIKTLDNSNCGIGKCWFTFWFVLWYTASEYDRGTSYCVGVVTAMEPGKVHTRAPAKLLHRICLSKRGQYEPLSIEQNGFIKVVQLFSVVQCHWP